MLLLNEPQAGKLMVEQTHIQFERISIEHICIIYQCANIPTKLGCTHTILTDSN